MKSLHYNLKFNGKTYRIFDRQCATEVEARRVAAQLRESGYYTRIVVGPQGYPKYNLYVRWGKKKK